MCSGRRSVLACGRYHKQDRSGAETTVAFAMLLLKQLLDRGLVSAGMQPWEGCKDETGEEKKDSEKSGGGGGFFGKRSSEHKKAAGQNQRQLHAVVLARNKEIAVNVTVRAFCLQMRCVFDDVQYFLLSLHKPFHHR